jgi:chromosomal replication initiation ATPase DnaA
MTHWTEAAIAAALDGHFWRTDGRDFRRPVRRSHDQILTAVEAAYQVSRAQILSGSKLKTVSRARQHAIVLLREFSSLNCRQIARTCGITHHSSVRHAVQRWPQRKAAYAEQDRQVRAMLGVGR